MTRLRLLGGTLGVAVLGSVYASLFSHELDSSLPKSLPHALTSFAHESVGAALGAGDELRAHGLGNLADAVSNSATTAFDHGMTISCVVAAAVAAAGAMLAARFLPAQPPPPTVSDTPEIVTNRTDLVR